MKPFFSHSPRTFRFGFLYKYSVHACTVLLLSAGIAFGQTDLARSKTAMASSEENQSGTILYATNAVDGNSTTRWASSFTDNQWISVDLGASYLVTRVILNWEAASAKNYRIEVSANNTTWDTLIRKTNMATGARKDTLTGSKTGRYVRMFGETRNTTYGFSLYDFTIFGTVSLATAVTGSGSIGLNPTGGSYLIGTAVTCTATPQAGWKFANWTGDLTGTTNPSSITMNAAKSITAVFTANTYTITASAGTGGSITPAGAVVVNSNASQSFSITPGAGYQIAGVLVDGASVGAVSSYTFTNVTANHTISASFSVQTFTITASAAGTGGTISPSGAVSVTYAANQAFTIAAGTGYQIANVLVDGVSVGPVTGYTFTNVTSAHTIAASFSLLTFTITAGVSGTGGTISPSGAVSVTYAGSQTFAIAPSAGYQIATVLVDGASVGAVASYTFTNVTSAHTITASFSIQTFTITASAQTGGTITPVGAVSVTYAGSQAFAIAPAAGYQIANVLVDGASVGPVASYTFTNVTSAHTIAASFSVQTFIITASAQTGGTITPSGTVSVTYNASQTFTIAASPGYQIASVLVDGVSVGVVPSYTFSNVTASHTIAVGVAAVTYLLTLTNDGNGATTPSGAISVLQNAPTAVVATPNAGYVFNTWNVTSGSASISSTTSPTTQVTLTSGNATVTATFVAGTSVSPTSRQLSISGTLTDASGTPLGVASPVTVDATVRLFASVTGGTELYRETFWASQGKGITVDKGVFVARLGTGITSGDLHAVVSSNADLFVEITIEGATPDVLLPRTPLTAAGYALGAAAPAAPSQAAILHGTGNPNNSALDATIGTYFVDDSAHSTWLRVDTGWKMID